MGGCSMCCLRRPWLLGLALCRCSLVGWFAYNAVPTGFMPAVDEGGFILDYYTPRAPR